MKNGQNLIGCKEKDKLIEKSECSNSMLLLFVPTITHITPGKKKRANDEINDKNKTMLQLHY